MCELRVCVRVYHGPAPPAPAPPCPTTDSGVHVPPQTSSFRSGDPVGQLVEALREGITGPEALQKQVGGVYIRVGPLEAL